MPGRMLLAAAIALGLSGCGKPLGEYRFENARLVPGDALQKIDPHELGTYESDLIRIELSSETDLEALRPGDLYVHGDFCPYRERYALHIRGPYYTDRPRMIMTAEEAAAEGVSGTPPHYEDGNLIVAGDYPNRHPRRDPKSGRFIYTAYLLPRTLPTRPQETPYDLRSDHRDLCLQIDSPGYAITESRSRRFTIPGEAIAAALRAGGTKSPAQ